MAQPKTTAGHEFLDPCISGDLSAVKAALHGKSPASNIIDEMLTIAAHYEHLELVEYLIQNFSAHRIGHKAIFAACKTGSKDVVSLFLKKDPSILTIPHFVGTPLTAAITAGTPLDFLQFLIDKGADPNGRGSAVGSVLHVAAYHSPSIEAISFLLQNGARLEKSAALSGAVQSTRARNEKVKFLLEQGADPNTDVTDSPLFNNPPLHMAVEVGDLELVNMLLEHGADPNIKAWQGRTAFDCKFRQDIGDALNAATERYDRNLLYSTFG